MNPGGETADQVVKMTLQGIEVAANISLKAGGAMTKSFAATLYAILTDKKKVKGKARLDTMLKSGKELKVFGILQKDLKQFCQEAKRFGVLYTVLKEKNNPDGYCEIMVRVEDAGKISRMIDKYELATVNTEAMRKAIMAEREGKEPFKDVPTLSEEQHDDLINDLMASVKQEEKTTSENPTMARTRKKSDNLSERTSKKASVAEDISEPVKPSVRKELKEIKQEREERIKKKKNSLVTQKAKRNMNVKKSKSKKKER